MQGTEYLRAINRIHRYFVETRAGNRGVSCIGRRMTTCRVMTRGVGDVREHREVVLLIDCVFFGLAVGSGILIINETWIVPALLFGADWVCGSVRGTSGV